MIKHIQNVHFCNEQLRKENKINSKSHILNLYLFLKSLDTKKVDFNNQIWQMWRYPIILPNKSKLTDSLIDEAHKITLHRGMRLTIIYLRSKHWILRSIRTLKQYILKCVRCRRFKTAINNQLIAELPKPRVTPLRPYTPELTSQDKLKVKTNKGCEIKTAKGYIDIFICLATKAVRLCS